VHVRYKSSDTKNRKTPAKMRCFSQLEPKPPSGGQTKTPAKIAGSDTRVSVPEDGLANKAEHFDIPAYGSDPGSGEEE
jgi:hypothetical protein